MESINQYHNYRTMLSISTKTTKYYPDIAIFLILIPVISAINYYLTYPKIEFNWYLVFRYTIDTLQGYVAWLAVRKLIFYLDLKLPYQEGLLKRILWQWITTTLLGLFIIGASTEILSLIVKNQTAPLDFYTIDMVIIGTWFFLINAIYLALFYYNTLKNTESKLVAEKKMKAKGFKVQKGKRELVLDFENLSGFYVDSEYTTIIDSKGNSYYTKESLNSIIKQIPEDIFFRLNRKFILNRATIEGFERIENGKLSILTKDNNAFPTKITVSRDKAPLFKKWL
ncbi:LytTR family DNA-binding domain-containing protein [Echinicola rosea]|uniref:HTH LytTR-type domain-containing protein n=1 Tax=Echinicola rosea TaxID=1807691 RepID=A0ABQ1UKL9_9BACT|nr:LytTR family DNA-binding domain-containing protein [Echinicola rosea]GGF21376.1 hypothetical protein GCM10011339_06760 [Echinicola rosea]